MASLLSPLTGLLLWLFSVSSRQSSLPLRQILKRKSGQEDNSTKPKERRQQAPWWQTPPQAWGGVDKLLRVLFILNKSVASGGGVGPAKLWRKAAGAKGGGDQKVQWTSWARHNDSTSFKLLTSSLWPALLQKLRGRNVAQIRASARRGGRGTGKQVGRGTHGTGRRAAPLTSH